MRACLLGVILAVAMGADAVGGSGGWTSAQYGDLKRGAGLQIEVNHAWVDGDGYRPVRITIRPIGKPTFVRDRQVTIRLNHFSDWNEIPRELTTKVIDLPAGAAAVTDQVLVQQNRIQRKFEFEFWEGRRGPRNVMRQSMIVGATNEIWCEAAPSVMLVDFDAPTLAARESGIDRFRGTAGEGLDGKLPNPTGMIHSLGTMWPSGLSRKSFGQSWVDVAEEMPMCDILAPSDLPVNWIGLTSLDVLGLSLVDLQRMKSELPAQWAAVDSWVRAGGMLWIFDGVDDFGELTAIDAALGLGDAAEAQQWQRPAATTIGNPLDELAVRTNYQWINGKYVDPDAKDIDPATPLPDAAPQLAFRDLQLGTVVVFNVDDPFAQLASLDKDMEAATWNWILKTLQPDRWMWTKRHGMSPVRRNPDFWEFLVPGVGLAPVNSFRVIITLFVLLIGPVNFVLLNRWQRQNWILFTVPVAALLITLGLVGYALLTDGISVRARVRSITVVDQQASHAVTWERQSYYAGLAPSGGLSFPADVAVFPLDVDPIARFGGRGQPREMVWDQAQRLPQGFLGSRNTAQFLLQRSRPSELRLELERDADGNMMVKNKLHGQIEQLLLRDEAGRYLVAEQIADEESAALTLVDVAEFRGRTEEWVAKRYPSFPAGVDIGMIFQNSSNSWRWTNPNSHLSNPQMKHNRSESLIAEYTLQGGSNLSQPGYLAVMKGGSEVPLGVPSAKERDSFYLIVGRW